MANQKIHLLMIDPQNDFCDLPDAYRPVLGNGERAAPALPVMGAHRDMLAIAALIDQGGAGLSAMTVTLDSHQRLDIAHPTFWQQGDGSAVMPFTQILAADVRAGRYQPRLAGALNKVLAYLDALEANGRYVHMVWPVHCEIGSWGHNVHEAVRRAYNRWEEARVEIVGKVFKGTNPWTEHYSAIQAEVPEADDAATQLNAALIARLCEADCVLITGEAGSHCVKATTEHIADNLPDNEIGKLVLLTDCMSAVGGFEAQYVGFIEAMQKRGARIATSQEVLPELLANAG